MADENERLLADLQPEESVVAVGHAIVVTSQRIIRPGHKSVVSIPFTAIHTCETWTDAHRLSVRLHHMEIDPYLPPCDATQWWRWHDRRAYRRVLERSRKETTLHFSREHTKAAEAISAQISARAIPHQTLPSPDRGPRQLPQPLVRVSGRGKTR